MLARGCRWSYAPYLALALLWCAPAAAQRAVDLERFSPALDAEGFLGVQGTRTPDDNTLNVGFFTGYSNRLLRLDFPERRVDLVEHRLTGVLSAEFGLGSRSAFALSMPLVLYQSGERLAASDTHLSPVALVDPSFHFRYRFLGDTSQAARRDGPGLALQLSSTLPAGDTDAFVGEGAVRTHAQLLGDMHLLGAGVGASVGWRHRFRERTLFGVALHDEFTFGAALKVPIPPLYKLAGIVEFRGATDFKSRATTSLEGDLGLRYSFGPQLALTLMAGPGFSHGVGTPAIRVLAGLYYAPADVDADHDGVPDKRDGCPFLPEDPDGFEDGDGCPDPDNDNDLVPDADDLCPNQQAEEDHDKDEDGCTDK